MAGAASHPLLAAPEPGRAGHRALPRCRALRSFPCYGGEGGAGQRQRDPEADAPLEGCRRMQPQEQMALQSRRAPRVRRRVRTQAGPVTHSRSAKRHRRGRSQHVAAGPRRGRRGEGPGAADPGVAPADGFPGEDALLHTCRRPFTWTAASGTIGRTGTKLVRTPCSPRCSGPRLAAVRPLGTVQTAKSPAEKNQTRRRVKTVALTGRPGGHHVPPPPGTGRRRLGVSPRSVLALQRPHTRPERGVWGYGSFSRVVSEFINLESE